VVHSAAQQARTDVTKAVSSAIPRKLSNWPAKFAPLRSSIRAEERTAEGAPLSARCARQAASSGSSTAGAIGRS
jgi:hypothetical protein